jgi:hypothetical protein
MDPRTSQQRSADRRRDFPTRGPLLGAAVLTLVLLLGACGGRPASLQPTFATASLQTLIDDTVTAPSAVATERVLAALGAPLLTEQSPTPNLHDPMETDRVHTLIYDGVRAVVIEAVALDRSFLVELQVTADGYTTPEGIGIGSRRSEVIAAFGKRLTLADGAAEVTLSLAGDRLLLEFAGERVVRLVWDFYIG